MTSCNDSLSWCSLRLRNIRGHLQERSAGKAKPLLQVDEIVADSPECVVVPSGIAAAMGVLAQQIDLRGERPKVVVRPDMDSSLVMLPACATGVKCT